MALSRESIKAAYEHACRMDVEALKPGNVHHFADGHGMSAAHFITSADVTSAPLTDPDLTVGERILEAVRATRQAVGTNTNLGIVLLAAPIIRAAEMTGGTLRGNLDIVLGGMGMVDAKAVFEAIVTAAPGGLGAAENDVRQEPKVSLLEAMREAASRDMVARQYATGFSDVFDVGLATLDKALSRGEGGMWPAIFAYMAFLSGFPDSHVMRNHGADAANQTRQEAVAVGAELEATTAEPTRIHMLMAFDRRLKARNVNPGTSADLTVASLLVHSLGVQLA